MGAGDSGRKDCDRSVPGFEMIDNVKPSFIFFGEKRDGFTGVKQR